VDAAEKNGCIANLSFCALSFFPVPELPESWRPAPCRKTARIKEQKIHENVQDKEYEFPASIVPTLEAPHTSWLDAESPRERMADSIKFELQG
jgi:hypothetical protein